MKQFLTTCALDPRASGVAALGADEMPVIDVWPEALPLARRPVKPEKSEKKNIIKISDVYKPTLSPSTMRRRTMTLAHR